MEGLVFFAGSFLIEGGLVFLLMWLITAGERAKARPKTETGRVAEPERKAA